MIRKTGWKYIYSDELNMEVAYHLESGWVYTQDGVRYSPEELKILDASGCLSLQEHLVKKQFGGTIERSQNRPQTTGTGSPASDAERKGKIDNQTESKHIPEPAPVLFHEQNNCLNIY